MCSVIREKQLSSDDLAMLACKSHSCEPDDTGSEFEISDFQPGDAFGFGPICLSQIVRPVDPRMLSAA